MEPIETISLGYTKEYYERYAEIRYPENLKEKEKLRIKIMLSMIPEDVRSIIDIGCGDGRFVNSLVSNFNGRIMGLDLCEKSLKHVRTKTICSDISEIPLPDSSFDLVICSEVLEHLPKETYLKAVKELKRISRKYIMVSVPYKENFRVPYIKCERCSKVFNSWMHMRTFSKGDLKKLFKEWKEIKFAFTGERLPYFNNILLFISQRAGNKWATPDETTICPYCGNSNFKKRYGNKIAKVCELANSYIQKVIPEKKTRWIIMLFQKEKERL